MRQQMMSNGEIKC